MTNRQYNILGEDITGHHLEVINSEFVGKINKNTNRYSWR
jgi:hypothetical protein